MFWQKAFGPQIEVQVTILGLVGSRVVHFNGTLRLRGQADVAAVLKAAGKAAGADLLGALQRGAEPAVLLDGERLGLPEGLNAEVAQGASVSWLMPLAGG